MIKNLKNNLFILFFFVHMGSYAQTFKIDTEFEIGNHIYTNSLNISNDYVFSYKFDDIQMDLSIIKVLRTKIFLSIVVYQIKNTSQLKKILSKQFYCVFDQENDFVFKATNQRTVKMSILVSDLSNFSY